MTSDDQHATAQDTPTSAPTQTITIRHTHEDGTVLEGSHRGDGVWEIVRRHGFSCGKAVGIHIHRSRDRDAARRKIEAAAAALRDAGYTVAVEIDDTWRPAQLRRDAADERADERADRLAERAGRAAAESARRHGAADQITEVGDQRALAVAYLAVFDRLTAGETVPAIAATLTPVTGTPAWQIPADQEPEDVRVDRLQPGDLVAGIWNNYVGGMLSRQFCGPVGDVSEVRNRREAGDWVTVTLTHGDTREMPTHRWAQVYRPAAEPARPAATDPRIIQGPLAPTPAVTRCAVGGEDLPTDHMWWLVALTDPADADDRHAACAAHTGVSPMPYIAPVARITSCDAVAAPTSAPTVHRVRDPWADLDGGGLAKPPSQV